MTVGDRRQLRSSVPRTGWDAMPLPRREAVQHVRSAVRKRYRSAPAPGNSERETNRSNRGVEFSLLRCRAVDLAERRTGRPTSGYRSVMNDFRGLVVGVVSGLVLAASACSPPGVTTATPAAPPTPASTADQGSPAAFPGRDVAPEEPAAPATYVPVRRNGKPVETRIHGNQGKLDPLTAVRYDDGVKIRIRPAARRSEKGSGPGVFPGRSFMVARIELANDSRHTIDLTQVVVTTTHGRPARIASPVYPDASTADFATSVKPGRTATAQYAFAIADQSAPVTIIIDWDGAHAPAVFTGRAS